jgi:hypothetical protein
VAAVAVQVIMEEERVAVVLGAVTAELPLFGVMVHRVRAVGQVLRVLREVMEDILRAVISVQVAGVGEDNYLDQVARRALLHIHLQHRVEAEVQVVAVVHLLT